MENSFEKFELNRQLLNAIEDSGYTTPTPIQEKAIPLIMKGHDVLGIAQTGTGKTAAYLLPVLMKIKYAQGHMPRCIIFAPTRELVIQIDKAVAELAKYTDLRHTAIYGGLGPKTQIETIKKGIDIIVATPGRFMESPLKRRVFFLALVVNFSEIILAFIKRRGRSFYFFRYLHARNLHADYLLNFFDVVIFRRCQEGYSFTNMIGTPGSADTMYVVFINNGHIEINNM